MALEFSKEVYVVIPVFLRPGKEQNWVNWQHRLRRKPKFVQWVYTIREKKTRVLKTSKAAVKQSTNPPDNSKEFVSFKTHMTV